jgi:AraC-like DNA-binding protein
LPRRRLERLFARDFGIRPKLFARIVRLNDAMTRLGPAAAGHGAREAAVTAALEAGYFDQSHMSRDFRAVAGRRPGGVPGGDRVLDGHFTRPERLLEWLAGE